MIFLNDHKRVLEIIGEILVVDELNLDDSPSSIPSWDSFAHFLILTTLADTFNINLPDDIWFTFLSVEDLIDLCCSEK